MCVSARAQTSDTFLVLKDKVKYGSITSYVKEAKTKEPLPGAVVIILGTMLGANTDLDRRYIINNVSAGACSVQAKMMGFESETKRDIRVRALKTSTVNF
ncbi:MAG: carboxypeptidase-like regulatory domain-containing protein, partial [Candidatus Edwardsbacteria bacterium]|nr:carboxypeptidase-like regulatory domain-containing protein [Candidatus Edwardsbacteria bacterium]